MVNNLKLPFNTTCTCNYCLYLGNHRPFHGFFQLLTGTSENRSLRNTSKLVKDAKFESGFLKLTKIIKLRKDVCRVGGKFLPQLHPPPLHKGLQNFTTSCRNIFTLFQHIIFKLSKLPNFRYFLAVAYIYSLTGVCQNLKKKSMGLFTRLLYQGNFLLIIKCTSGYVNLNVYSWRYELTFGLQAQFTGAIKLM